MQPDSEPARAGARTVVVDLVVAGIIFALGALLAYDSHRLGASWGDDGPQTGYFPFYVALLICISSAVVLVQALVRLKSDRQVFVEAAQLRQVLIVLVPSTLYVLAVDLAGIYVASAIFIGLFMRIMGRYSVARSAAVGLGVSVATFVLFEVWFKIPLPKGPLESFLGL
jgi:hypothetical protein